MAEVHGYIDPRFESIRKVFSEHISNGQELGASLAVELEGKLVIDIWGGHTDPEKSKAWEKDTIVNVWSSTKAIASLAMMILADRGIIDLDGRVSQYWPEFAQNGKENITIRNIISHTSGVAAWDQPITAEDLYDFDTSTARLAKQAPWWEPGTQSGYHALTHGHLISAVVRRVTGKTLKEFVAEEIARPLHADFQLGAVESDYDRIATIVPFPPAPLPFSPDSMPAKIFGGPALDPSIANTTAWRQAEVGSVNGHTNARALAKMMSPLVMDGTVDGVNLLSKKTINEIFNLQADGLDLAFGFKSKFGTGFGLPAKDSVWYWAPDQGRICGWGGWGGSMAMADLDRKMTIGYAMNKMQDCLLGSQCTMAYIAEIYKVLGVSS